MRVIVVGAGGTGGELVRRLGARWEVVLVDTDPNRLEIAGSEREAELVTGDGSSAVVLDRAGLGEAAAVVAATPDDDANLEIIKLALDVGVARVVGVAGDPRRVDDYRALGVPVYSPNRLAARNVELELEPRRVASSAFAGGKAEAIELHIAPDAAVAGRTLGDLHSKTWVVAAVLRDDRLIVPHGDTVLEAGDRVTVVGAAADYGSIVETFTAGVSTFPLSFGRKVAVGYPGEVASPILDEAARMVRDSRAEVLVVVVSRGVEDDEEDPGVAIGIHEGEVDVEVFSASGEQSDGLISLAEEQSIGVMVVPGIDPSEKLGARLRMVRLLKAHSAAGEVPLLLARAVAPYTEVVVPARRTRAGEAAARAAIDLAGGTGTPLVGVAAVAPAFVATRTDTLEEANLAMAWLREEAAVHGLDVERRVHQGNPVRVMADQVGPTSLLVVGAPPLPAGVFRLGIAGLAAARVPASVLLVPTRS